jgi:hypothetical protein
MLILVGLIVGLFEGFTQIEGFGSIVMLVAGWGALRLLAYAQDYKIPRTRDSIRNMGIGFGILLFAFIGFAVDQPGNRIYNFPIQWLFCPADTQLQHGVDVQNPRPGSTVVTQEFMCVDSDGQVQQRVSFLNATLVRFVEYILIGYLLLWLSQFYTRIRWSGRSDEAMISYS